MLISADISHCHCSVTVAIYHHTVIRMVWYICHIPTSLLQIYITLQCHNHGEPILTVGICQFHRYHVSVRIYRHITIPMVACMCHIPPGLPTCLPRSVSQIPTLIIVDNIQYPLRTKDTKPVAKWKYNTLYNQCSRILCCHNHGVAVLPAYISHFHL
ncbi:uncharacterized protein [Haliotis asinina]|uniref:uncharacterized protein n=1 Tax=Haliotis asinina TaxID=109174 RepID=UPI003531CA95